MKKRVVAILTLIVVLCTAILTSVSASNPFADVKDSDWFYNDVEYVRENKLMSGTSDSEFSPSGITTRGMIVTVLWRLDGSPVEAGKDFEDVKAGAYYYDAVAWASNNGIVSGYSETTFGPDDTATREQLATIVYRYASHKKYDVSKEAELDKYVDQDQISEYAAKSIKWANASGLITGTSEETISPKNDVQRSQLAAILKRFCLNIVGKTEVEETPVATATPVPEKDDDKQESGSSSSSSGSSGNGSTTPKPTATPTPTPTPTPETPDEPVDPSKATISIEKVTAKPGDEVEVEVKVTNNPGILGMTLNLSFDDTMCTLVSAKNGAAFEGPLTLTTTATLGNGAVFLWDGVDVEGNIKDGTILVLTFKVNDNAEDGVCTIKLTPKDICDNDMNDISANFTKGEIKISK